MLKKSFEVAERELSLNLPKSNESATWLSESQEFCESRACQALSNVIKVKLGSRMIWRPRNHIRDYRVGSVAKASTFLKRAQKLCQGL